MGMFLALISSLQWKKRSSKSTRRVRGRKRRGRGDDLVAPEIPWELQIEILTRLPAKSLMRFKYVSKLWSSLIRSRYFTNRHFTFASPPRPPRLYISLVEHLECDSMEVCHKPRNSMLVSLLPSTSDNDESFHEEETMPRMGGHNMVVLRGLILYTVCRKACIYNPTTRQSLTLPAVKSDIFGREEPRKYVLYSFGYDPVLDQYKVVCTVVVLSESSESTIISEHWVFLLEVEGFWRRIEFDEPHIPTRSGVCINGVIYYLASARMCPDIVVSFDVRSEEFSMIQAPDDVHEFAKYVGFIEYSGRPTILDHTNLVQNGSVELWVLEDGGKWSTKSLVLRHCQMDLVVNDIPLKVEGTTRNGEVILAPEPYISPSYILYYDLQKNELRKVNIIIERPDHGFIQTYIYFKLLDKSESIMHLET